jgi:hypothetical protein
VAAKTCFVCRLFIRASVFGPGGHGRGFASDGPKKNEKADKCDDDRYKDQIFSSHKSRKSDPRRSAESGQSAFIPVGYYIGSSDEEKGKPDE